MKNLQKKLGDESGAVAIEYLVIGGVMAVLLLIVMGMLSNVLGNKAQDMSKCIGTSTEIIMSKDSLSGEKNNCRKYQAAEQQAKRVDYNGVKSTK